MFNKIKEFLILNKLLGQYDDIKNEIERTPSMKDLLSSKRFWISIIGILGTAAQIVPPKIAVYLIGGGAILTKIIDIIAPNSSTTPQ